jgi:septation ring formation regulator EzrA
MNNQFEELRKTIFDVKENLFSEIDELIATCEEDADKFYEKGNKSAGTRIRKSAQLIRKQIHHPSIRKQMVKIEEAAKTLRSAISETK